MPLEREDWFERNGLNQYNWGPKRRDGREPERGTSDPANGLRLRLDVADLLEDHHIVFFPAGDGTERLMTYLCRWSFDYIPLAALLHRRLVTLPLRVVDEFLYARFGHTMINNLRYLGWPGFDNTFPVPERYQTVSSRM